jgi:hypothetical protein
MQTTNTESCDWAEDEDFVAELNERVRRYEEGIDRAYTWEEFETALELLRRERVSKWY